MHWNCNSRRFCFCRRLLECPDIKLFSEGGALCECGSGMPRLKCCHMHAREEDGGVIWPYFHCCTCSWAHDAYQRPNVRVLALEVDCWGNN